MESVRRPAVAGQFYPADPGKLERMVTGFLAEAVPTDVIPKAIIAPHAGYIYSGPIAASAYAHLKLVDSAIQRVILLGPSHRVALQGLAASSADGFSTPLGTVPVDKESIDKILKMPQVHLRDDAHMFEHSLEVHLPFLQTLCERFSIVPLAVGSARTADVAEVLEALWGGPETLIVVSSDLSHFHDYETAQKIDALTSRAIEKLDPESIGRDQACGRVCIKGLLQAVAKRDMKARVIDVRNSGDTAGPRREVVGYGAYIFA